MTLKQWLESTAKILINNYGLDKSFAAKVAEFYAYLSQYGLHPVITSGYRSAEYQKELLKRYLAGDSSVIVKPATNSKHSITKGGRPASLAIDISTNNHAMAAKIATALGIGAGQYFKTPDGVHFYI